MPDGTGTNQGQGKLGRGPEILGEYQQAAGSLQAFREAAEKVERDPNVEIADKIRNLNGNADRMTQLEGISAFTTAMVSMMAKLEKAGGDLELVKKNPDTLPDQLMKKGLVAKLKLPERTALETLPSLIRQDGDTANYLRTAWPEIVDQGLESSKGWTEKLKNQIKKDPVGTIGLMAIGVGVAWAGWSLISKLWKDKKAEKEGGEDGKKADTEKKKDSWLNKKILIPVGIMIAGGILGKAKLQRLLAGLGIDDLQKLLMSGEAIPEEMRQQIEEQKTKIEQLEEAAKEKATGAKNAVVGAAAGVAGVAKDVGSEVEKIAESPDTQFVAISRILIAYYCYDVRNFDTVRQKLINKAFVNLRGEHINHLKVLFEQAKSDKSILRKKLTGISSDVKDDDLYVALSIIAQASEHFKDLPGDTTVEQLFIKLSKDPVMKLNDALHSVIIASAYKGNFLGMLSNESLNKIGETVNGEKNSLIDTFTENLHIDMSDWIWEEKTQFGKVQLYLYDRGVLTSTPQDALRAVPIKMSDNVRKEAENFFEQVQKKSVNLLPQIRNRFGVDLQPDGNILEKHLNEKEIDFAHALQLVLVSEGMDFDLTKQNHEFKELALLGVVIQSLSDKDAREIYIGQLGYLFAASETNITLPSLKALKPYFKKLLGFAKYKLDDWWAEAKNKSSALRGNLPSDLNDFNEKLKNSFWTTWALEAGGGTLQIASDAVAPIMAAIDARPEDLASIDSAEDFLSLVLSKGGSLIYSKDKETGEGTGLINIAGEYFIFKPLGVLANTISAAASGEDVTDKLGMAVKAYVVGASPFVVIGAAHGFFFRPPNVSRIRALLLGAGKGLRFPATFAYDTVKITGKGVSTAYRGYRWTKESLQTAFNWTNAFRRYGLAATPRKNITLMLRDLRFAKEYYETRKQASSGLLETAAETKDKFGRVVKRYIVPDYINRQSQKYGIKGARRYNRYLYGYSGNDAYRVRIDWSSPIEQVEKIAKRADRIRIFFGNLAARPELKEITEVKDLHKLIDDVVKKSSIKLEDFEQVNLIRQIKTNKDVEAFKGMLEDAAISEKLVAEAEAAVAEVKVAATEAEAAAPEAKPAVTEVTKISEGKYRYMGKEFEITESEINKKITDLKYERAPKTAEGAIDIKKSGEVKVTTEEAVEALCKERYVEVVKITETRVVKTPEGVEVTEYKVGDKWVRTAETPEELAKAKEKCAEELEKAGKKIDPKKLADSKVLKFFNVLQEIATPAIAALVIYQLESANTIEEKEDAVVEMGFGFAAFEAGAKVTAAGLTKVWKPSSVKAVMSQAVLSLLGGLAAAAGVQKPIESLIDEKFPLYVSKQKALGEMSAAFEKLFAKDISRALFKTLGKEIVEEKIKTGILRKGIEMAGWKTLGSVLDTKIKSTVFKKVGQFASKSLGKKVIAGLGVRGATIAALAADDATVVGILDDVVAAGLLVWTAIDIVQIVQLTRKAYKIKDAMEKGSKLPIKEIMPSTETDKKTLADELEARGKRLETMSDSEMMDLISSIADIRIKITRQGKGGYEEYHFSKGEVLSVKIMDETGEIFELSDEELNQQIGQLDAKEFKPQDIDYNAPKDKLLANFRMALLLIKSECGWTKMDHEIIDENTISIKRLDGKQEMKIRRSGDTWSIEGVKEGLSLYRAAALANLINKIKLVLESEGYEGSPHPFEIEGGSIDFNKKGSPIDLRILSEDFEGINFYRRIGFDLESLTKILNAWYEKTYYVV